MSRESPGPYREPGPGAQPPANLLDVAAPDVGSGRRLAVDVGSVRVGVALSDPAGVLATPLVTLDRDRRARSDLRDLAGIVVEYEVVEVVIGLPRTLAGRDGPAATAALGYARELAGAVAVPVRMVDERLTTVVASRTLSQRGVRGRKQRAVVDQVAAVTILQSWLDTRAARASADPAPSGLPGANPAPSGPPGADPAPSGSPGADPAPSGPPGADPAPSGPPGADPAPSGAPGSDPAGHGATTTDPAGHGVTTDRQPDDREAGP